MEELISRYYNHLIVGYFTETKIYILFIRKYY